MQYGLFHFIDSTNIINNDKSVNEYIGIMFAPRFN
jgi:hypothetical protein